MDVEIEKKLKWKLVNRYSQILSYIQISNKLKLKKYQEII